MFRFLADKDVRQAFRDHQARLSWAIAATFLRALLALGAPYFLGRTLDVIEQRGSQGDLARTLGLMFAFAIATAFGQFWMRWLWIGWSRFAERSARDRLFEHVIRLSAPFFDRAKIGELLSRFTSDVEAVRMGYGPGIMHCAQTGLMLVGALALMLAQSASLTLLAILPLAALYLALRTLLARMHEQSTRVQEEQAALSARAQETFSGARVVKAFAREEAENERFGEHSARVLRSNLELAGTRALFSCAIELANALVMVVVLFYGGRLVFRGELSLGDYASFVAYLQMMIWPMIALSWTLGLFQRADAAQDRLRALMDVRPTVVGGSATPPPGGLGLEIKDLSFTYPDRPVPVLDRIDVHLAPGRTLGVVGPTASGKTTLVQLILRLHEAPPGKILLAGRPIEDYDLKALRGRIAVVPQETFLFGDTLRANLTFGVDTVDEARLEDAVHRSCLDQDLSAWPDGLLTIVGERGIGLSGGQRQRVAIARALLLDADILILDDALSAVDVETEQRILARLQPVLQQKTAIIVAHRLSSVQHADEILVLEHGRIAERGRHAELLRRGGAYARTYKLQQDERALETLR